MDNNFQVDTSKQVKKDFLKKTKIPKIAANPHKIRLKLNRNEKDLSNFSINCQTNFVDVWRDSL